MPGRGHQKSAFQKLLNRIVSFFSGKSQGKRQKAATVAETGDSPFPQQKPLVFPKPVPEPKRKKYTGRRRLLQFRKHKGRADDISLLINPDIKVKEAIPVRKKKRSLYRYLFGNPKRNEPQVIILDRKPEDKHAVFSALRSEFFAMLNSLGFFLMAYLVVYLLYQFTEALTASHFNIDSVLFYYEIYFPIGNASNLWNKFNVIAITFASPFISLILSLILLRGVLVREKLKPQVRLFLLWVAFHAATHFLGAFVAGIATSQGFGYVVDWLYLNVFFRILISLVFLFLLTLTGYRNAVFAFETIPPGIRQYKWKYSLALFLRFILVWIIGGLMVIVVKFPNGVPQHANIMVYDAIIIATMGFMVIPIFFNRKARPRSLAERPVKFRKSQALLVFVSAVVVLVLFRLLFSRGIHLIINFSFDVGFYR